MARIAIAIRMTGKANIASRKRLMIVSNQPPKNPAKSPSGDTDQRRQPDRDHRRCVKEIAGAVDDAAEDVASLVVGSEEVVRGSAFEAAP